jgi:hypothetical protein
MIPQQKMHSAQSLHFKPINRLSGVFLFTKKLLHALDRHERAEPIPFVVVTHEESAVAI